MNENFINFIIKKSTQANVDEKQFIANCELIVLAVTIKGTLELTNKSLSFILSRTELSENEVGHDYLYYIILYLFFYKNKNLFFFFRYHY